MTRIPKPTRGLLVGLFGAGLFYALVVAAEGRWADIDVITAIAVEILLILGALFREPIDKKGLIYVSLGILGILLATMILGVFTEMVVMTTGGMALYAFGMSEPKFPMTKRAMVTGIIVGTIITFLGIYLNLKLGVVYFIGAEMLGAIILGTMGLYTPEENTIVVAIANSSGMISVGVLVTFPAIAIWLPTIDPALTALVDQIITIPFIMLVIAMSGIFGMILLLPWRDMFEDEPWPQVQPQAETILALGADPSSKKAVLTGMAASGAWMGVTKAAEELTGASLEALPNALAPAIPMAGNVPEWIGVSNSPLIAGVGYFVGWKRVLIIAGGSVISLLVWIFLEGAAPIHYGDHLHRAEIIYMVLGIFVAVIARDILSSKEEELKPDQFKRLLEREISGKDERGDGPQVIEDPHKTRDVPRLMRVQQELFSIEMIKEEIREIAENPRAYLRSRRGQLPSWVAFVSLGLFILTGIIIFWFLTPFPELRISWLLFVLGSPLAMISAYFTARAVCETGMLAGYISDIIAIPAILFFRVTFQAITTFMAMLGGLQDAALALLVHLKLGRLTGVRGRDIVKAVLIGMILGALVGSVVTFGLFKNPGFGGSELPSPAAQLFGFLVISLSQIGEFQLPGVGDLPGVHPILAFLYLLIFAIAGFLAARELGKRGYSAISLGVGVLIPPATAVTMLFGAYIKYRTEKKYGSVASPIDGCEPPTEQVRSRITQVLSGVVAGEAVVTIVWVIWSILLRGI
ncbi:MAG: OPT/YSL family transporter [Candidatus Thorarchaeota archaeon]